MYAYFDENDIGRDGFTPDEARIGNNLITCFNFLEEVLFELLGGRLKYYDGDDILFDYENMPPPGLFYDTEPAPEEDFENSIWQTLLNLPVTLDCPEAEKF